MNMILRRNIIKKAFAYLILGVVGLLILNKAVFLHTHKLADGTVILHAHPFHSGSNSNSNNPHQHTKGGYLYFDEINLLYQQFPDKFTFFEANSFTTFAQANISFDFQNYHSCLKNRAPPEV
jgi:hypothetical protein